MIFETDVEIEMPKESWEGPLPPETNEQYHARKGYLTSSLLKERVDNAFNFHMMQNSLNKVSTDAFDLGSSVHEVLLTGDYSQFVVMPEFEQIKETKIVKGVEVERVAKTIKAQKEEFEEANKGMRIISLDQYAKLIAMVQYARSKPDVRKYLSHEDALFEQSYLYADPVNGEKCQFRPDEVIPSIDTIIDYKTCQSAAPYEFKKACERYYYHLSAAHYASGYKRIYGRPLKRFIFIAQESSYPFKVGIYELSPATMAKATMMRRALLEMIRKESIERYYPDYADRGVITLELSGYAFEIGEERV